MSATGADVTVTERIETAETIRAIGIAVVVALIIISFGPPPGDAAAHL